MNRIELKDLCDEVLITLNNLRDCEIEENGGNISVTFNSNGVTVSDNQTGEPEPDADPA